LLLSWWEWVVGSCVLDVRFELFEVDANAGDEGQSEWDGVAGEGALEGGELVLDEGDEYVSFVNIWVWHVYLRV